METKSKYKMTEVGEIPIDWEVNKLKSIGKFSSGTGFPEKYQGGKDSKDIPFFKVSDMNLKGNEVNMIVSNNYVNSQAIAKIKAKVIDKKSIIFAKVGAAIFLERKRKVSSPFLIDNNMMAFSSDKSIDFNYLYYLFSRIRLSKYAQVGALPSYNASDIGNIKVAYPESSLEQQKIAEILSIVDEQIEQTDQLIEKTKELKKGLMQQLLTKGIEHSEFKQSELGEIPGEWNIHIYGSITQRITVGIATSTSKHYVKNGIPMIRNQNIKNNKIIFNDLLYISSEFDEKNKSKRLKENDIITVRTGYPGQSAVVPKELENAQSFTTLISTPNKDIINSEYLSYYINSPIGMEQLKNMSAGGAQQNLNAASLRKLKVVVPSLREQQQIAEILSSVDEDIEGYEEEKVKYEELKKGLMQQLLTGKTRVKVD